VLVVPKSMPIVGWAPDVMGKPGFEDGAERRSG
jgi:hypothetical protein